MLSNITKRYINDINNRNNPSGTAMENDSFICEVLEVSMSLTDPATNVRLINSLGDTLDIYPGMIILHTMVRTFHFNPGTYPIYNRQVITKGTKTTPEVSTLTLMLKTFNARHQHKVTLSNILKNNIKNLKLQLCGS